MNDEAEAYSSARIYRAGAGTVAINVFLLCWNRSLSTMLHDARYTICE